MKTSRIRKAYRNQQMRHRLIQFLGVVREVPGLGMLKGVAKAMLPVERPWLVTTDAALAAAGERFAVTLKEAMAIEGMTSEFSMQIMDALMTVQEEEAVTGHLVELGVFRGRSAVVLGRHVMPSERLVLADLADYVDRDAIRRIAPGAEIVLASSHKLEIAVANFRGLKRNCRIIHVDSDHRFRTTMKELTLSENLIKPGGIVILDDFANLNFSQVLAATHRYLSTARTDLMIFLVTHEKAYLCQRADFDFFGGYVLERLQSELAARGNPRTCLARTDCAPEYRAFHLRALESRETEPRYAESFYRDCYRGP
jgi:hypothetical protein